MIELTNKVSTTRENCLFISMINTKITMAPNVNLWFPEINSAESIHNLGYPNISNIRLEKRAFKRQKNEESVFMYVQDNNHFIYF
jgi:hypothetical protein